MEHLVAVYWLYAYRCHTRYTGTALDYGTPQLWGTLGSNEYYKQHNRHKWVNCRECGQVGCSVCVCYC